MPAPRPARPLAAVAALLLMPAAASAAGFGQPVAVPGTKPMNDPTIGLAADGRFAIGGNLGREVGRSWRTDYAVVLGAGPAGPFGKRVRLGRNPSNDGSSSLQLLARPDGALVACFTAERASRRLVIGCRVSAPGSLAFGPFHTALSAAKSRYPGFSAAARPDGTTVLLVSVGQGKRRQTSVVQLGLDGAKQTAAPLTAAGADAFSRDPSVHALADGTLAIPATIPTAGKASVSDRLIAVRLAPPGSLVFGPAVVASSEPTGGYSELSGTATLKATYGVEPGEFDAPRLGRRTVQRAADGTWGPAMATPGGPEASATIIDLPGGGAFAFGGEQETDPDDSDCYNQISGTVTAGPLRPFGTPATADVRLSARGQIALWPQAGALADGTVVASWENAASFDGDARVQAAIREPGAGAFHTQVLPVLAWGETPVLATAGTHALLAWSASSKRLGRDTPVAVSALQTAPPYAKPASLPRHPEAPCDE